MDFSVITPSYRQSDWLKLCVASVADQNVPLEHIIQDAGSDDGTVDWLKQDRRVKARVEKDCGMYDAINRGFCRAAGDVISYLNCDEQYLPAALQAVSNYFAMHPDVDVLFGNIVMVDACGDYLWHRKMQVPLLYHTWVCHLSTLSCGMFFRRRIISELKELFDTKWRDAGDAEWMIRLLRRGVKMGTLGSFTSAFTQTGTNMSAAPNARRENLALARTAPAWARAAKPLLIVQHRVRRLLGGMYFQAPFSYSIYTKNNPRERQTVKVQHPRSWSLEQ